MADRALNTPAPPLTGGPSALRRTPRPTVRAGAAVLLAAALVWPAAGAHALAPVTVGAVGTDVVGPQAMRTLSGRVTSSTGAPFEGVEVQSQDGDVLAVSGDDGGWAADVPGGPVGLRFVVSGPDGAESVVYWDATPYGTYEPTLVPDLGDAESRDGLDLVIADNTATGTVTAGGLPVAGATVGLHRWIGEPSPSVVVTTAADGTWTARWLRPGSYAVRVTPPAGSGLAASWWDRQGDTYGSLYYMAGVPRAISGVDVPLSAEARVTGRVVDEAGRPVADVTVALWTGGFRPSVVAETTTTADGTYTFDGLDAGRYTVQVTGASPADHSVVASFLGGALGVSGAEWTQVGAQDEVVVGDLVRRLGGTIAGTVVGEPGWDGPGLVVEFVGADGSVVAESFAMDAADGPDFATAAALPAGEYRVRGSVSGDAYRWAGGNSFATARVLDVRPGTSITDVELVLSDEYVEAPPAPTDELTEDNRGGLGVAAPVVAGDPVVIDGVTEGLGYVWLAPSQGLGFARAAGDGVLRVTIPAATPAGDHRLAVTTPGGFLLGWADVTVLAAPGGALPGSPVTAAPPTSPAATGAAGASPTTQRGQVLAASSGNGSTAVLATTGAQVTLLGLLALVLIGGGVVLARWRARGRA